MRIAKALATCLVLAALPLLARTIALWPLNWNGGNNRPDGGNAVSDLGALGNLSVNSEATFVQDSTAIGWSLPPPSATRLT